MTLMLAGSVIASVFNTLGAIPGNVVFFLHHVRSWATDSTSR